MKHAVEEFSSYFCFSFAPNSADDPEDLCGMMSFQDLEYNQIFEAVEMLDKYQQKNFYVAVSKIFENLEEMFASKKRFMRFVLSRCMKLSEKPTFFSFIVVCTYIYDVMKRSFKDQDCFLIAKMASKCVIAAFNRKYKDVFDKEGGFKEFNSYCEKLNVTVLNASEYSGTDVASLDLEGFSPPEIDEVTGLLESLGGIEDEAFQLTDEELKLLYDRDMDPSEDIFIPFNYLNIKSEHVLMRAKEVCQICKDNCYKHVVFVARELKVDRI